MGPNVNVLPFDVGAAVGLMVGEVKTVGVEVGITVGMFVAVHVGEDSGPNVGVVVTVGMDG